MPKPNFKFDIEYQYQLFLHRMDLNERTMHEQQKIQLRQAFFGAVGQLLILQRDEISELSKNEAIDVFTGMIEQTNRFWQEDTKRHQASKRLN